MTIQLPRFLSNSNVWLEKQQVSILSAAAVITSATMISGVIGLIRNRILISVFYQTPQLKTQLEAYLVSFRLPELVFQLLVIGALSAAYIPVFTKYEKKSKEDAFKMGSSVLNIILIAFGFFSLFIYIFARPLTELMTGTEFTADQIELSANMTRIMLLAQFFFAISNFLSGTIQSYKRFLIPALSPIAYNLGIIFGAVLLSPQLGIYGPVIGVVLGAFLHVLLQVPLAIKLGLKYYPIISWDIPGVKEVFRLMAPRTMALSVTQIQLFSSVFFATHFPGNALTIITYAQHLMTLPIRVFGAPIGQAALPFLSKESNDGDMKRFQSLVLESLHQISFFAMPASVLLLILRIPIVRLVYGTKDFPWPDTLLTGRVVAILAISISAQAMVHILIRAFYALHDTKNPLIVSLSSTFIYLALSTYLVFFTNVGITGVAIAISVSTIAELLILLVFLNKKISILTSKALWIPQAKMFVSSFLMAVFLWFPFRIFDRLVFDTTRTIELIGLTISVGTIGMLTYIMFAYLLDIKQLLIINTVLETIGSWKSSLSKSTEVVEPAGQSDETPTV